jgi:hypothetical protein
MPNKLLTMHRELLYPGVLGAALFEFGKTFAKTAVTEPEKLSLLPVASSLWFLLYFSAAFLALVAADTDLMRDRFGKVSFFANLAEIGIILLVSLCIEIPDAAGNPRLNYWLIYLSWILIPLTGGLSNACSGRTIRTALSLAAIGIGCFGLSNAERGADHYGPALFFMYLLLIVYYRIAFARCPSNVFCMDFPRKCRRSRPVRAQP